jgi:hypothetical protein
MTRGRAWRRHIENKKVIKRLTNRRYYYWRYTDNNSILINNPTWVDAIGSRLCYLYKNITTTIDDTKNKTKWGHRKKMNFDYTSDPNTRVGDKKRFKKELNELGFKHLPTEYKRELEDQR